MSPLLHSNSLRFSVWLICFMSNQNIINTLQRLFALQYRSFTSYLRYGHPYHREADAETLEILNDITTDQMEICGKITELLDTFNQVPLPTDFPMVYTDSHDLSVDFLIADLIYYQKLDIEEIHKYISDLSECDDAKKIAEEALGREKAHLDTLQTLVLEKV
jgi:hypothetical protein